MAMLAALDLEGSPRTEVPSAPSARKKVTLDLASYNDNDDSADGDAEPVEVKIESPKKPFPSKLLPGILAKNRRQRPKSSHVEIDATVQMLDGIHTPTMTPTERTPGREYFNHHPRSGRRPLALMTPSSAAALTPHRQCALTPMTPDPKRCDLNQITGDVAAIIFDFDGTLTTTPGDAGTQRWQKKEELCARAHMLAPRLKELVGSGYHLGIMSKSTEGTISHALEEAGLSKYFDLPLVGKAVGFEGKVGFIKDMVDTGGALGHLGLENLGRVLLIDDDIYELDRARREGIQTWTAPVDGGLQDADFDEIFTWLNQPAYTYAKTPKTPGSTRVRMVTTPCRRTPRHCRVIVTEAA
eukprot:TRINITY_DN114640_c0_g1_i1.p1 TRINITY_DN114640_c0_g1~~TRINITY_DN114640_c0_g1_i1.p1  ORF type:complete len:355 (+),score=70.13 TRINITY_DN114640_c0_g1_i1:135-1199(+)